ncbi:MAG TPA: HAMP domain-containing sensor histidine kinase [Terriglobales bacterium]|nr:HAMP domain-containing sensor histidine kinase [Terriglobales bacterium]
MKTFSIRRRIVFGVAVAELLLVASLLVLATSIMRRHAQRSFDAALYGRAMSVAALVRFTEGPQPQLEFDGSLLPRTPPSGTPDLYYIESSEGKVLAASPADAARIFIRETGDFELQGIPYRAIHLQGLPVLDKEEDDSTSGITLNVAYASSTQEMRQSLFRAMSAVLIAGVLLLGLSVWLSVWAIRSGLRPLSDLATSAAAISATNWQLDPPPSTLHTVEVAPLTAAMKAMLSTLRAAFEQQRDFTANAAHELKTPVAILKSTLQSLVQQPRSEEAYRAGINDALADLARLETLLHSLLRLARAEQRAAQGTQGEVSAVDVVATCESAIVRLAPFARSRSVRVVLAAGDDPIFVHADSEDLEIIWTNLIENAIRYAPAESEVEITGARRNGSARITVRDSGPGVPPEDVPHIFDRFHRGDRSRSRESGGYGLGLAITRTLIDAYGGSITFSPAEGGGACFVVELPQSDTHT